MAEDLRWKLDEGATPCLRLEGAITEHADFVRLGDSIRSQKQLTIDMQGVRRINSCGVREWVNLLRSCEGVEITLDKCSPEIVAQLNMIANFAAGARVRSVMAPFLCEACGHEGLIPVDTSHAGSIAMPAQKCPKCGEDEFVFDDAPEAYFAFRD